MFPRRRALKGNASEGSEGKCLSSDVGEGGDRNAAGATKEGCAMQPEPRPARKGFGT